MSPSSRDPEPLDDAVDRIRAQWRVERPDLDTRPMGVIGRLSRTSGLVDVQLRSLFAEYDLGDGDFDALASLRRAGPAYRLTPTQMAATMMVTSGAVTKRIDRLERLGLVERTVCAADGRGRSVALTPAGRRVVDDAIVAHMANEHRILAALDDQEWDDLSRLLKKLLVSLEE